MDFLLYSNASCCKLAFLVQLKIQIIWFEWPSFLPYFEVNIVYLLRKSQTLQASVLYCASIRVISLRVWWSMELAAVLPDSNWNDYEYLSCKCVFWTLWQRWSLGVKSNPRHKSSQLHDPFYNILVIRDFLLVHFFRIATPVFGTPNNERSLTDFDDQEPVVQKPISLNKPKEEQL